jgi:hypothetical protein
MSGGRPDRGFQSDEYVSLVTQVRARYPMIYDTIHAHVREAIPGPQGEGHAEYEVGLYEAVVAAVDYGLEGLETGDTFSQRIPSATIAQARLAARQGVPLDAVLRRYHAGNAKLIDLIIAEIERSALASRPDTLRRILAVQATLLDRLTADIATEYMREADDGVRASDQFRAQRVARLLSGASRDTSGLDYRFDDAWHLCVVAMGAGAQQAVEDLAARLDRQLLVVSRGDEVVVAWLGGPWPLNSGEVEAASPDTLGISFTLGEPGAGLEGWRLSHRQAHAAHRVALLAPVPLTRYADVALLAAWVLDHELAQSFIDIYLAPLSEGRDGGAHARDTLLAYFAAGHQIAAAAARLGVDRGTLRKRLTAIEERLGYALHTRQPELEIAMRLAALYGAGYSTGSNEASLIPVHTLSHQNAATGV